MASGLLIGMAGYALLTSGDALVKTMNGLWPPTAIAALRYIFGALGIAALLTWREGRSALRFPDPALHIGRGVCVAIGSACFFISLGYMPLSEATVIQFVSPVLVALFSALFLKEPAPPSAWVATFVAFAGVALVIRPNLANIGLAGLLPLCTAFCMAIMIILNRKAAGRASALRMQYLISSAAVPALLLISLAGHMSGSERLLISHLPDWTVVARCALLGVSASCAHMLIFMATERVSAALLAPLTYVQILVAVLIGVIFFSEWPDAATLAGSALVIIAGLILWRGTKAAGRPS